MTKESEDLYLLERRYAMHTLLYLLDHETCKVTDLIMEGNTTSHTRHTRVKELIDAGFITHTDSLSGRPVLTLTREGYEVAKRVRQLRMAVVRSRNQIRKRKPQEDA